MDAIAPPSAALATPPSALPVFGRARSWFIGYAFIEPLAILADVACVFAAAILAQRLAPHQNDFPSGEALGAAVMVSSLCVCLLKLHDAYGLSALLARRTQSKRVATTWAIALALFTLGRLALGLEFGALRELALFAVLGLAFLLALRAFAPPLLRAAERVGALAPRRIMLLSDPEAQTAGQTALRMRGCAVSRSFELPAPASGSAARKRFCAQLIDHARVAEIDEIVIAAEPGRWTELRSLAGELRVLPFPILFVPVGAAADMLRRPTRDMGATIGVELQRGPLAFHERAAKRAFDVAAAAVALVALSPLLALAALAVRLDSPGPVLFRQRRCGFNGKTFSIYKFRTMSVLEDGASVTQASRADARVTRAGKWLRRTSIDELPQLLNVLEGSMSLVGPRPHALVHDGQFDKRVRNYAFRRRVKPGLTGWAQVHGCRGATPTADLIERRVDYDLWYIDNWTLTLDMTILLRTPIELLRARNAF